MGNGDKIDGNGKKKLYAVFAETLNKYTGKPDGNGGVYSKKATWHFRATWLPVVEAVVGLIIILSIANGKLVDLTRVPIENKRIEAKIDSSCKVMSASIIDHSYRIGNLELSWNKTEPKINRIDSCMIILMERTKNK